MINMIPQIPYHRLMSAGSWWGNILVEDTIFRNFDSSKTFCGVEQKAIELNQFASDYVAYTEFKSVTFDNVDDSALIHIFDPPSGWAKVDDCGQFPCTAP